MPVSPSSQLGCQEREVQSPAARNVYSENAYKIYIFTFKNNPLVPLHEFRAF